MSEETRSKTFEVTLSGELLEWAEGYVVDGVYPSVEAVLIQYLQDDMDEIAAMVKEGLESGICSETPEEIFAALRSKTGDTAA